MGARVRTALTIAGSDSGGGAGIQADLKSFASVGVHGTSVITCVTAQNTRAVESVFPIPPAEVRKQLGAVLGDFDVRAAKAGMLFSASIADNIRYGRLDASMDEIVEAAQAANAHDFIMRLPDQYETVLGERGAKLSTGERQRISVGRAFLKNAPILILDEPTSSIDSKTEAVILDALDRLMMGRTTFIIAHRLSTIRYSDIILVMNQGRLCEQGTHDELVNAGGMYSELHKVQTSRRASRRVPAPAKGMAATELV